MLLHDFHHFVQVLFQNLFGNREVVCRAPDYDFFDLVQFIFVAGI
jgi:hypothetical protein